MSNRIIEREQYGVGYGQYSDIKRENWQPITFQGAVLVPMGQALVIACSWGVVIGLVGLVVCQWQNWPARYALLTGVLGMAVLTAWQAGAAIEWTRGAYIAREQYTAEKQQGAAAERSTMTVEWVERAEDGNVKRMRREGIPGSYEELAVVVKQAELSKRILTRAGIGDDLALEMLAVLTSLRYIGKVKGNEASVWTAKGQAWRRGFSGGGGGGGAVVDVPHQLVAVGEGGR